jgi:hypothetical protein
MELLFFGDFFLGIALWIFLLIDEGFDFAVADLEDSFDDVGSGGDDVFDIILAHLVVELLQHFLWMGREVLLRVFQLASLVAAEVVAT